MIAPTWCKESRNISKSFTSCPHKDVRWMATQSLIIAPEVACAQSIFNKTPDRDEFAPALSVADYSQNGQAEEALQVLQQIQAKGKPNKDSLMIILSAFTNLASLHVGRHSHSFKSVALGNTLVDIYCKRGSLENAREVFDKMPVRNVVSWTAMISGYARHGLPMEALKLFQHMECEEVKPNEVTFVSIIKACATLGSLEQGKQVHADMMKVELVSDVFLESALVDMYAKCASIEDARLVFDRMPVRDVVSWTTMIAGYAQHGYGEEVLHLYHGMQFEGVKPNEVTFSSILNGCASIGSVDLGRQIHSHIVRHGIKQSIFLGNTMMDMYAKCGSMEDAWQVFDKLPNGNVVSWTSMITGYTRHGHVEEALKLFQKMEKAGVKPNMVTFLSILNACAHLGNLELGKQVHAYFNETGMKADVCLRNTLIDMYAKCGCLENARKLFDEMPERNVVSWSTMIAACAKHEDHEEAFKLFREMHQEGVRPNEVTFTSIVNACAGLGDIEQGRYIHGLLIRRGFKLSIFLGSALVHMYAKCGSLEEASEVFDKMSEQNLISWNWMIAAYAEYGHAEEAFKLYKNMQGECMDADEVTLVSILNAAANLGELTLGRQINARIMKSRFESDVYIGSALIDMYAKCGSIEDACQVFDNFPVRNVVLWTAMMAGYAQHGYGKEVLHLAHQMQEEGLKLNHVTFVGVLSACSHSGLVDEGQYYFDSMSQDHNITPTVEHYACIVDLLGRCGRLQEAEEFIKNIPFQPSSVVWLALLGACKIHANMELAKRAIQNILQLEPQKVSSFVLLSNIYTTVSGWDNKA